LSAAVSGTGSLEVLRHCLVAYCTDLIPNQWSDGYYFRENLEVFTRIHFMVLWVYVGWSH